MLGLRDRSCRRSNRGCYPESSNSIIGAGRAKCPPYDDSRVGVAGGALAPGLRNACDLRASLQI